MNSTATSPASAASASLTWLMNSAAVGEVGERVVEGLVVQLLLQLAQLEHRLLQPVVLERHAGVVGERLEQLQVVVAEGADHAEPVGEHDRADHAVLAGQHREHRVGHAAPVEVAAQPLRRERAREADARRRSASTSARRSRRHGRVHGLHHLLVVAGAERGAQRRAAVGAEQDDLGHLGAERLERALQQALEREHDLRRARERARGLVQELEPLVALPLHQVGAVGEERP